MFWVNKAYTKVDDFDTYAELEIKIPEHPPHLMPPTLHVVAATGTCKKNHKKFPCLQIKSEHKPLRIRDKLWLLDTELEYECEFGEVYLSLENKNVERSILAILYEMTEPRDLDVAEEATEIIKEWLLRELP